MFKKVTTQFTKWFDLCKLCRNTLKITIKGTGEVTLEISKGSYRMRKYMTISES